MSQPDPARQPDPQSSGTARPQLTPAQLHHHEMRFLKALKLLIDSGKAKSTADLIRYAEQDKQTDVAAHLRQLDSEGLPVDLAYDALSVHTRIVAHKRNSSLLTQCLGKKVGLLLPLPPHVIAAFTTMTETVVMLPDGHHWPANLTLQGVESCHGSRESRQKAEQQDVLVFEAFAAAGKHFVGAGLTDIVDLRIIPATTQLIVHLRPHRNPDDVELQCHSRTLQIL